MAIKLASFLLLIVSTHASSQMVQNLVFEGAGIRGIAYSGAIRQLEENNMLPQIRRVGGTSAGAITALAVALGYSSAEIEQVIASTPFNKFNDGRFFLFGGINRMKRFYGWYRGRRFEKWLAELIEVKTGNPDISFLQLNQQGFKELYVTGTCINRQKLVVFSSETYPDMRVRDAIRISMSIPLYFEAVFLDSAGRVHHRPSNSDGLDIMVDGGFIANFPIRLFDSTKYMGNPSENRFRVNMETIGFRIDTWEQIRNDSTHRQLAPMPVHSFPDYLQAFYRIIIENLNRQQLTDEDWARTISISDGNISPRIRHLKKEETETLVKNGQAATDKYFSGRSE